MKRMVMQKIGLWRLALWLMLLCLNGVTAWGQAQPSAREKAMQRFLVGFSLYQQGRLDSGCVMIYEAASLDSAQVLIMEMKGLCQLNDGQPELAIRSLGQALALDPERSRSWVYRGEAYTRIGEYKLALDDFEQALVLAPEDRDIHFYKGKALTMAGSYAAAIAEFEGLATFEEHGPNGKKYWALAVYKLDGAEIACPMLRQAAEEGAVGLEDLLKGECKGK